MKQEAIASLVASFPTLFRLFLDPDERDYPMRHAISSCPDGWESILRQAFEELLVADPGLILLQVKSKWGSLDIHSKTSSPDCVQPVRTIVGNYSKLSQTACADCGCNSEKTLGQYAYCQEHKPTNPDKS